MIYALVVGILASIGLNVALAAMAYKFGTAAIDRADKAADARTLAAQREGEAALDAHEVADANTATATVAAAEKKQEQRGDALEKELADEEVTPRASGLDRLHALESAGQAGADSGAAAGGRSPKP